MDIFPFIKEHGYIVYQDINSSLIGQTKDLSFIDSLEVDDCFTGVINGRPVVCGGVIKLWDGCFEGWVIASTSIQIYSFDICKTIRRYTDNLFVKNNMHRLQTAVIKDFDQGYRFAQFLGMKQEGIMKKYDYMKKDYMRFARVK